ncbi:hypothetical protein BN1723_000135 [Verticillium longisporum]|uniref:Uncharacterized protein n=1 Tax=Verticillium longisporum TaxID=100787 RepID=A0A0G4KEI4_VERLO|nr:hypothetical protein BN1723_000135 [Verticillium longisporum]
MNVRKQKAFVDYTWKRAPAPPCVPVAAVDDDGVCYHEEMTETYQQERHAYEAYAAQGTYWELDGQYELGGGPYAMTYQGHKNAAYAVGGCFGLLPDGGAFVASASEDGDVVLWDVSSKDVVQRLHAHPGLVCFWVDVRRDTMVTAGQDGSLRVFVHATETHDAEATAATEATDALTNGGGAAHGHAENGVKPPLAPAETETSRSAEPPIKVEDDDVAMDGTSA